MRSRFSHPPALRLSPVRWFLWTVDKVPGRSGNRGKQTMESDDNKRWRETKASLEAEPLTLGHYFSFIARKTPRRLLHLLSYYKFASRMIGPNKRVVDVGCSEGFGTTIVAEASKSCLGVDLDADAIAIANQTVGSDRLRFEVRDIIA